MDTQKDQRIKTYSRKDPIANYKSATALVAKYPNPADHPNVRESRVVDKTLIVETLDDTFDRIAKEVPRKFSNKKPHYSSSDNDSSSSDFFNRKNNKGEQQGKEKAEKSDEFSDQENLKLFKQLGKLKPRNCTASVIKNTGNKRKKPNESINDSDSDSEISQESSKVLKFKKPKQQTRKAVKEIREISKENTKSQEVNSDDQDSETSDFLGFSNEFLIPNVLYKKGFPHNFPTSTPKDCKQKLIVNMQNSPSKPMIQECLSTADIEPIPKGKLVLRESNLNTITHSLSKEPNEYIVQKLMLMDSVIGSHHSKNTVSKVTSKEERTSETEKFILGTNESINENNSSITQLLGNNANIGNAENNQNTCDTLDSICILQSNADSQFLNKSPSMINQRNKNNISFVESPLLFNSTYNEQNKDYDNSLVTLNKISDDTNKPIKEYLNKSDKSNIKVASLKNLNYEFESTHSKNLDESSFSPHEWSNDCDSSYEYSTTKDYLKNETKDNQNSTLENSFKKNQVNVNNLSENREIPKELQSVSDKSSHQHNNSEIQEVENIIKQVNIFDSKNESNNFSTEEKNTSQYKNDVENDVDSDNNSTSFELRIESNTSSTRSSPTLQDQKNLILNSENAFNRLEDEKINISQQIVESGTQSPFNKTIEDNKVRSIQIEENDKRLNGQKVTVCLTKLSLELNKSCTVPKETLQKKGNQTNTKNVKTTRFHKKKDKNLNIDTTKAVENFINTSKLGKQSFKNKSFTLSGRITKDTTKKNRVKQSLKISKKMQESYTNYIKDIVKNGNLQEDSKAESSVHEFKKLKEMYNIKDFCIKLTNISVTDLTNKSSVLMKQSTNKVLRRSSRKSRSVYRRKNEYENENIDISSNKNITINTNQNHSIDCSKDSNTESDIISENEQSKLENVNKVNVSLNGEELCEILSQINDPVMVTMKRNPYKRLDRSLAAIKEDFVDQPSHSGEKTTEQNIDSGSNITNKNQHVFLKPGKLWARSLTYINNFHPGQNLEKLAVGRGKNWRCSVQNVLNMQPEDTTEDAKLLIKENVKVNEDNSHPFAHSVDLPKESYGVSSIVNSSSRLSRFSIRIIPDGKRSTFANNIGNLRESSVISDKTRKTSLIRKSSLKVPKDTLIVSEEDIIISAKDMVLKYCKQDSYLQFSDCFPNSYIQHCRKIGEGVYGEVFLYQNQNEKSVIKIIPIEGEVLINSERQKKFHEILSEIIISEELHKLKFGNENNTNGFVGVKRIMCVIGKYPEKLIDLWVAYDEEKNSENDCPSVFNDMQLYIILELAHGGQDLEAYVFQNASESYSIFLQTAFTLAVAEKSLEFEHRDLHWGNILVSESNDKESTFKLDSKAISLPNKGVKVSVIDFTLSRMSYQSCKIFNDLATDPTLFTAQGEYQFDIYRMMRDSVNNDWQQFNPFTNILWLDYILDKMITAVRYKRKSSKIHKSTIQEMNELRKKILSYKSAFDFVTNCEIIIALTKT